uniref:Uncharacterized protein n=1 Tax=Setaria italica TaxID=4555 RepID=K3ZMD3_SETIT
MADLENPVGGGGGDLAAAAAAEPNSPRDCETLLAVACMVGLLMAVCVLPVFFYRAHRTAGLGVRLLAVVLLILGSMGLVVACCCCTFLVVDVIYGNPEGWQQRDEEAPLQ